MVSISSVTVLYFYNNAFNLGYDNQIFKLYKLRFATLEYDADDSLLNVVAIITNTDSKLTMASLKELQCHIYIYYDYLVYLCNTEK